MDTRTMPASHLPELCLENIFMRVPLHDLLLSVRVVCSNWRRMVPTELRHRHSVVLVRDYKKVVQTKLRELDNPFGSDLMVHVRREDGSRWAPLQSLDQMYYDVLVVPGGVLTEPFTTSLMNNLAGITHLNVVQLHTQFDTQTIISILKQTARLLNHYRNVIVSLKLEISPVRCMDSTKGVITSLFGSINKLKHYGTSP